MSPLKKAIQGVCVTEHRNQMQWYRDLVIDCCRDSSGGYVPAFSIPARVPVKWIEEVNARLARGGGDV